MKTLIDFHTWVLVIVERADCHAAAVDLDAVHLSRLSGGNIVFYCFKYIRFFHLQTMQKASGFHRKSDASQFHILLFCRSDPSFTLPAFPVLPVSVQFTLRQLLLNGFSGFIFDLLFASLFDLRF